MRWRGQGRYCWMPLFIDIDNWLAVWRRGQPKVLLKKSGEPEVFAGLLPLLRQSILIPHQTLQTLQGVSLLSAPSWAPQLAAVQELSWECGA